MRPRSIGRCLVPPRGLMFMSDDREGRYDPEKHGPLVDCSYATASYSGEAGECARCGELGCLHDSGKTLSREEWEKLPEKFERNGSIYDRRGIHHH